MIVLIQRVQHAKVEVSGQTVGAIAQGLLVLVGIEAADTAEDVDWLSRKVCQLRIFADEQGVMNKSVLEVGGEILCISQFTLHASTKKGNRPSYIKAARPEQAQPLYEDFCTALEGHLGGPVAKGIFGADMQVSLLNDGPVTLHIDSKNRV
ncbi:D-tyrosyl-tRNA(Tyr) deacylase [Nitritalea halalkaliphila LW7]|uniref:D-aminoacyl-tRNA deacylase n=1 Tax=Nitritalea halalkaliphila LW7 TaxID=1189621 RepID=I5C2U0_9BACT|nr:D-aminoacyl-tRNA deacylase [Nitritalea halalkaliphila]EIM76142.1 D-tyrosyl-tRNA(Tyr) deacylase [Nitritalea halalkaliphila LW7]